MKVTAIERILQTMARLRSEDGCPWDREQTLESLRSYLLEETYEVLEAIDSGDREALRDELGDLLLQIVFQAQVCAEDGNFTFEDVAHGIVEKLVRRHPHVFGDTQVSGATEVLKNWEAIKKTERSKDRPSVLDGVPQHLPALMKAQQVQRKAARVGFDWENISDVIRKVEEELDEIKELVPGGSPKRIEEEIGDLLFAAANLCRFANCDAELSLLAATEKFSSRFRAVEAELHSRGKVLSECSLDELEGVWQRVKEMEKQPA